MHKAIVLVIDGGGRGSVLVDKYLQSNHVTKVIAIPGNDLMTIQARGKVKIFPKIKTTDILPIIKICQREKVDLADVAQDDAIACGMVDKISRAGINVFGPTKAAGQIEWDKAWARNFMKRFKIPTPAFKVFNSQKEGIGYIKSQPKKSWFIKASGLAAGKGALFAQDNSQAIEHIIRMKDFGKAAKTFLIEECLAGEEFSSFAIVNKTDFKIISHAQDHKPVFDGDLGPNTGGMGCSSPPMVITPAIENQIKTIFKKTIEGLVRIGRPYRGILYLGGMIDENGRVYVIEFNARWGDPEAQVIVPAIKNDFYELANQVIGDNLANINIKKDSLYRVAVAAASRGYPGDYSHVIGKQIFGLDRLLHDSASPLRHPGAPAIGSIKVFGAGIKKSNGNYLANGGRLFYVLAAGKNVAQARKLSYNALSLVNIEGNNLHYRTDIGYRDLKRYYQHRG